MVIHGLLMALPMPGMAARIYSVRGTCQGALQTCEAMLSMRQFGWPAKWGMAHLPSHVVEDLLEERPFLARHL